MYTSVDKDGTARFTSTFLFTSADNMIAFENSPFLYAPKYGGFCAHGLSSMSNASVWSREKLGPPVDLTKAWRVVDQPAGGLSQALVLFKDCHIPSYGIPEGNPYRWIVVGRPEPGFH